MNKILAIENQEITTNLSLDFLHNKGFEIIDAENYIRGIELAQEYLPDLIICHIKGSEQDSYKVLNTLRQNSTTESIPFIFISNTITNERLFSKSKLVSGNYDIYLTESYQEKELLLKINTQIQKRKIIEQWHFSRKSYLSDTSNEIVNSPELKSIFPNYNCSLLKQVFQFIEENYDRQINLSDVAEAVGYSTTYLTNQVKRRTEKGIYAWIIERRMAEACSLLLKCDRSVSWIATKVGYQDPSHFSRLFRQKYSISPKIWRDNHVQR